MNTQQPRKPRFSNEQVVSMLLAAAGIGVTLIGVVLLLAMAAREGMLTPPIRVAGGVVLAAALSGAAMWVRPRTGGRVGSVALLATAASAAFFDVVAVTRIYDWVNLPVGLALALGVAGLAGTQAIRWNEKYLFQAVVLGVAGLAPYLTGGGGLTLVAFLAVLQLVGVAPELLKRWDETALVRTVPVVLAAFFWALHPHNMSTLELIGLCTVIAVVGTLSAAAAAATRNDTILGAAALVVSWIPLWTATASCDRPLRLALCGLLMLVALGAAYVVQSKSPLIQLAAVTQSVVSGLMLALACADGDWRAMPFLCAAVVMMAGHQRLASKALGAGAAATLVLGVTVQGTASSYLDLFYRSRAAHLPTSALVTGVLLIVFAGLAALAVRGKRYSVDYVQPMLALAGASTVLGMGLVIISACGGSKTGFYAGHLAVTVLSLMLAALVLTSGLRRPRHLGASMVWGMTLVGCALAKLFFFDLHYMGSMTKAFTFMGAGLVLLAAGTVYARTYATVAAAKKPTRVATATTDAELITGR